MTGIVDVVGGKAHIAAALPYIEMELQKQQGNTIARAIQLHQQGQLTDERAKELWIELFVIMGLGKRLATSVSLEAAQAEKLLNGKAK